MSRVRCYRDGAVLRLTLNDEPTRNALSEAMIAGLTEELARAAEDATVSVIVIASTGKVFSSGHNLKELTAHRNDPDKGAAYFEQIFARCADLMLAISNHPCPVIAEVNGLASAAGCQLVASCDLAYASEHAAFCTPGVNIGLFCSTPMVPLSRVVGAKHAMEFLLTGDIIQAPEAARMGLINQVLPEDELSAHVSVLAEKIAAKSQVAIQHGKKLFHEQSHLPLHDAYALASSIMTKNMLEGAACEGIDAFIQKRAPSWPSREGISVNHDLYQDSYIRDILTTTKTVALVGASANPERASYEVMKFLLDRGYDVIPVNPGMAGKDLLGQKVYATLADIPRPIDMVDIFRNSEATLAVAEEAMELQTQPKIIWMQFGIRNDAAARRLEARNIKVVMNNCPKSEILRLGLFK
jgi:enoyl-CoA hydratase/carnithine racemase/predicted CoA-binding protein